MRAVLQFSGGKDSLCCLYLLRPRWAEITVAWTNTGAAFPETLELMRKVRALVPHFVEIPGVQSIATRGWPADIVPTAQTLIGRLAQGPSDAPLFQSRFDCCAMAVWLPMHRAMRELGASVVIRGQRKSDRLRSPLAHGQVVDGIEYQFPIADWSDAQVNEFLEGRDLAPAGGALRHTSSLDCWNCTAYLEQSQEKLALLRERYPKRFAVVRDVLRSLAKAIAPELAHLAAATEG